MKSSNELKKEILRLTEEYSREVHKFFRPNADNPKNKWVKGSAIPYAGRVFTETEVTAAVSSTLDFEIQTINNYISTFAKLKF